VAMAQQICVLTAFSEDGSDSGCLREQFRIACERALVRIGRCMLLVISGDVFENNDYDGRRARMNG
jgi:hypothetical protein